MLSFFPKQIAEKAVYIYLGVLAVVSVVFYRFAMEWTYIALGIMWVVGFFLLTSLCTRKWKVLPQKKLLLYLFFTALGLRAAWVVFSYFFYMAKTGAPFEFAAADAFGYWEDSIWLSTEKWSVIKNYLFTSRQTVSDSGYPLYLAYLGKVIGPSIIATRMINAVFSAVTVVLLYLLAKRNIGEEGGRMAGIMACFMPNLIYYCGLHLKESIMLFLLVAFLERADYLIRSKKYNVLTIAVPALLAISLFAFRTVLGAVAIFSLATSIVFTNTSVIGKGKRVMLIAWGVLAAVTLFGGTIRTEIEDTWESRGENQTSRRVQQEQKGIKWAKYATGAVMAPMVFVLPFPTMVDVDEQYNQQVISGGNYVRTFLGGFVLIALFSAIFITKNWRDLSLIGSYVIAYLGIVSMSGFAGAERFLLPGLPGLLILAAYGMTVLDVKTYRFIKIWYWVVPVMVFGWAFFKIGSRSLF